MASGRWTWRGMSRSRCWTWRGLRLRHAMVAVSSRRTGGAFSAMRRRLLTCGLFSDRTIVGDAGRGQRCAAKRETRETNGHGFQDVLAHIAANLSGLFALTREKGRFPRGF